MSAVVSILFDNQPASVIICMSLLAVRAVNMGVRVTLRGCVLTIDGRLYDKSMF